MSLWLWVPVLVVVAGFVVWLVLTFMRTSRLSESVKSYIVLISLGYVVTFALSSGYAFLSSVDDLDHYHFRLHDAVSAFEVLGGLVTCALGIAIAITYYIQHRPRLTSR